MGKTSETSAGLKIGQNPALKVVIIPPGDVATGLGAVLHLRVLRHYYEAGKHVNIIVLTVAHSKHEMGVAVFFRQ